MMMIKPFTTVYCIVRCPHCSNIQGGRYPIKRTRCQRCSKTINLERIGLTGTYESLKEMRAVLISLKWGNEEPLYHEGAELESKKGAIKGGSPKGRDGLRKILLEIIEEESSRDIIFKRGASKGYEIELIEEVIEELMAHGLIHSPRHGILKMS